MWSDIRRQILLESEPDSVMAGALLCMLMMCMNVLNLRLKCNVLMSVI